MKRIYTVKQPLKKIPAIYIIACTKTDKVYIGETINVSQRIQKHFSLLRKNKHSNPILQNIFTKYGEGSFIVDILEFLDTTDEIVLKTKELEYQKQYPTCISLDCNEIFTVERNEEWKIKNKDQLNSVRELGLQNWRVPIIIYNIEDKSYVKYDQLTDADKVIEQKHLYKNIKDKILIPYKNKYVAFLEDEFTEENISKIITIESGSCSLRNLCDLYNLIEHTCSHYSSKRQFSLFFSEVSNNKLYDKYKDEKILDFFGRCVIKPESKEDLFGLNINLRKRLSKTKCSFKIWYNALTTSKTNKEIVEKTGINRSTIQDIFKERSWIEWVQFMDKIISALPE